MNILFVTYPAFPLEIGGFQNQVREIFKNLTDLGHTVEWYHINETRLEKYDILHIFSSDSSMEPIARKANDLKIPVVLTPMLGSRALPNWYLKVGVVLSRLPQVFSTQRTTNSLIHRASFITPLSVFEKERIYSVYNFPNNKMAVIPNGINDSFFDNTTSEINLPYDNYILIVGRIENNKNQLNLIKAINTLNKNLIIVGEPGTSGLDYFELCKQIAGDNVYFWGKETDCHVLKKLYQQAVATVIPSRSEMVPLVIYESLIMGTPVVCTDRASIYGDDIYGVIFSDISVRSLSKSIEVITSNNYNSVKLKKQSKSWREIAEEYDKIYKIIK